MAKRKVSGPVKASKGGNSKTNTEPQVMKKEPAKQKIKTRSKVKEGLKSSVQDEELAPAEVIQIGRRRGRSAKLQAVQKMATMQEDVKMAEGSNDDDDDEDNVSLDLEYDDEEDEDDFEATLPKENRTSNTRQKPLSQGKSKQLKEDLTARVKQVETKYEERYVCQASQEQFLSLSESDSSSSEEDIGDSSKVKHSSLKPIPDKSKSVNAAADKSKLMETRKELTGYSPVMPSHSALKSMFDDLEDMPDLEGSQPEKDGRCSQSLFDDVDQESDHGDLRTHEEETDATPVVTSQYFANSDADECRSPDRKNLTLKEKLNVNDVNDARSTVKSNLFKSTLSDDIEKKEDDESEFEESPQKKAKKQIRKRPTTGKQAAIIEAKKTEKQTKKDDDPNASPATSQYFANTNECRSPDRKNLTLKEKLNVNDVNDARSTVKSTLFDEIEKKEYDESEFEESPPKKAKKQIRKRPTNGKQAAKIKEKKTEKQTKKDDDPNASPATSQYFANKDADECTSPDRKNLTLKEKLNINDARSTIKFTLSDEIEKKEDDESEFEESPPKKAKKQIRKRPTTGKQAAKFEEKKNEKQTKKDDDPNALPATSKKRGRTKSQSTTSNKSVVKPERRSGGETGDHPDVEDGIKNLPKKRKVSTGVKNSSASTVKKAGRGDHPDVKISIDSPAKNRKLSNRMKNSSADAVKKAGRGTTKEKKETKMAVKKMEIKVKEEDADDDPNALPATSKKRGRTKSQSTTSNKSVVKPERRSGGETGDHPDVEDGIKNLPKKRKVSTGVKNSSASTVKKAGRGDHPDVKNSIDSPAKNRKLSNRMKNSSADAIKKAGRGTTKGKKETKMAVKKMEIKVKEEDADMSSDDSHSDWEEVEDTPMNELGEPMLTPSPMKEAKAETMSLEIDIDLPGTSKAGKKKKKEYNWANYFQWQVNKYNKERQLELHKAHLVLLLASSFHSNNICNKMELQCVALSTIPAEILSKRPKQLNINYLSKVLGWFKNCFKIRSDLKEDLMTSLDWILPSMYEKRQAASERQLVHMFAIILRCLGVDVRLIFSLQPLTFKAKKLTKKFKKANEKAPVKKPLSQSSMQEQEKGPLKQSSSSSYISSPSKSGQSPSKPSSNKSSASAPKKHSTSARIKTTLSKSRQQPTKPSSSKLSASTSKTQSTSSNIKTSSSKAARPPSKSLSNSSSSSSTAKTQSKSSDTKTGPVNSGQRLSKASSSKSSASAPKTHTTSSNPKTTSSKTVQGKGKAHSGQAIKEQKTVPKTQSTSSDTKTGPLKSGQRLRKASSSKSSASAPKTQATSSNPKTTSSKAVQGKGKAHSGQAIKEQKTVPKTQSTSSDTKTGPLKSGQRLRKASTSKSSVSAPKTQATSSNPKTTSSKAVQGKGKAHSGQAIKEQITAPQTKPGSKMRFEMSRSTGKEGGEKRRIPSSGGDTPKRTLRVKNNTRRLMASKMNPKYNENNDEEDESGDDDHSDYEEELRKSASKRKSRAPSTKGSSRKKAKMASSVSSIEEVSSDNDFEEQVMSVTKQPSKTETKKGGIKKKASRKVLSSDSDESVMLVDILDPGSDCWLEVYLSSEKRWVCVDCVRTLINKPEMCEKKATQPITYVIGVENDGCVKDVTRRYACKWMTETHKLRPVEEWWEETLKPYQSYKDRDMKEDSDVQSNLSSKPFPTSIAEYKNHPLYALKRHLLKFEALYPESAAILGYCKGEPVYSRECVHSLHTRETWMKEGKSIRIGEKPYKMVKPRPKWKKGQGMIKTEEAILGIFGVWQVEDYIPPPAVDGKVPRNEYGNVELFKPTMLPAGTLHLKIPGLNKVARKLNIDCAPAMTGWDFHSGFNHPVMDGFVVCEEHVDVLVAAWEEDRAEQEKKAKEKKEARAMNHWKLFIKSLLIRERLKVRYGKNDPNFDAPGTSQQSEKDERKDSSPVKASWPENKMTAFTGDEGNLLPFEKKSKKKKKR